MQNYAKMLKRGMSADVDSESIWNKKAEGCGVEGMAGFYCFFQLQYRYDMQQQAAIPSTFLFPIRTLLTYRIQESVAATFQFLLQAFSYALHNLLPGPSQSSQHQNIYFQDLQNTSLKQMKQDASQVIQSM